MTRVLLGVTGSIAAYKAADLVRLMKEREWDVTVMMTASAERFVGTLTFHTLSQNHVVVDMFEERDEWRPDHVNLSDEADVMVVAPCTGNVLAKIAHGLADDIVSCSALACNIPMVIAPAMNEKMWDNPATQANVKTLMSRGIHLVEVGTGDLACGYQGRGRMAALDDILSAISAAVDASSA